MRTLTPCQSDRMAMCPFAPSRGPLDRGAIFLIASSTCILEYLVIGHLTSSCAPPSRPGFSLVSRLIAHGTSTQALVLLFSLLLFPSPHIPACNLP